MSDRDGLNGSEYTHDTDPPTADPIDQVRSDVQVLRADVSALRGEVRSGFADLRQKDQAHDSQLAALARRVTLPIAFLTVLIEGLRILASHYLK